jgi:hypothetical protein
MDNGFTRHHDNPAQLSSASFQNALFGNRRGQLLLGGFLWMVFCLGLLLQAFSAHLEIAQNAFVMPPALAASRVGLDPAAVVSRERRLQAVSSLLVLGSAIGLGIYHRRRLIKLIS